MFFLRIFRLIQLLGREAVVLWYACRHPQTPVLVKLLAAAIAVYVVYPVDILPDLLPVLVWVDDVTLLGFAVPTLLKLVPRAAAADARITAGRALSRWKLWGSKA